MDKIACAALAALLVAAPAAAQDQPLPSPDAVDSVNTIAAGIAYLPDYEGSNDYRLIPAGAIRASIAGRALFSRATYLYFDIVPKRPGQKLKAVVGPVAGVRLNRTGKVDDPLVRLLPDRKAAIELGGFAGFTAYGLTNPYDALTMRLDVVKDVGDAHRSSVVTPTVEFATPLSRSLYVSASASADWAGGGYADYYYSILPADSLASTLPAYDADGGFKSWKLGLLANQSLGGDLTHGLSLFATGNYSHLGGDFGDSPIVALRGSASQWLVAAGLGYSW